MILYDERKPPQGSYRNPLHWMEEAGTKRPDGLDFFIELYPEENVTFPDFTYEGKVVPRGIVTSAPRGYVAGIRNGRLWGTYGSVITPDNKLLLDVSWPTFVTGEHEIYSRSELPAPGYAAGSIAVLAIPGENNYFHWMFDFLPRIHLLQKSGVAVDKYITNATLAHPFQLETLRALGITKDKFIQMTNPDTFHLKVERLILPSVLYMSTPKWACDFLRNAFLKKAAPGCGFNRIYISREDSSARNVVNEDVIAGYLEMRGFRKIILSRLSLTDQIACFEAADVVVGPHGAGLGNLVFCKPGTKVVELTYKESLVTEVYRKISMMTGLDYHGLLCERAAPYHPHAHWDSIWVELETLHRTLEHIGMT